jgi:hypothetical protein
MTDVYIKRSNKFLDQDKNISQQNNDLNDYEVQENLTELHEQTPLELQPVIKSIRKYALQVGAIGMTLGIRELEAIINRLVALNTDDAGLLNILKYVEHRHEVLKETFKNAYKM